MPELIALFMILGWVSIMLKSSERSDGKKGSVPRMKNPPPPPKTKCICNNISNHSPGGRCEACWSKITKPSSEPDWIRM